MSQSVTFQSFQSDHLSACMALFDDNCPKYFAPNEKQDYQDYLATEPLGYYIALKDAQPLAAFGFSVNNETQRGQINWIMVAGNTQGTGIGKQMMTTAKNLAKQANVTIIDIAASHLSSPFFAHFGAKALNYIEHGWGPDMHRIDMEWLI